MVSRLVVVQAGRLQLNPMQAGRRHHNNTTAQPFPNAL
jgi:hypothetical protein